MIIACDVFGDGQPLPGPWATDWFRMADLSDVETALLALLSTNLFPQGVGAPSAVGGALRLYRGWPVTAALSGDIAAGIPNVSVFAVPQSTRNTTRWGVQRSRPASMPGTSVVVVGNTLTIGGLPAAGDVVGLLIGGTPYVYPVQAVDTPTSIAAGLSDLAQAEFPCLQAASQLTFPTAPSLIARVVAATSVVSEWARQEQGFRVSVWTSDPAARDTLSSAIGKGLAPIAFLTLVDGTAARLRYRATTTIDEDRDASLYRRDLIYDVEYATTTTADLATMLFGDLDWNGVHYYG